MASEMQSGFLSEPVVTFDREDGHVVSAYIKLRDGIKAEGSVQPNPDALVFFFVASDGLPIGIRFHEPVSGLAVCRIVDRLVEGPSGPEGVASSAQHHFLTKPDELRAFLKALGETLAGLEEHTSSDSVAK